MGIKSLDDLKQIREQRKNAISLRHGGDHTGAYIEVLVGMATCGIAAGARETLGELTKELAARHIENVRVIPVGCIGLCKVEPIVQVNVPGEAQVVYGNVTKELVAQIIDSHIVGKKPVERLVLPIKIEHA